MTESNTADSSSSTDSSTIPTRFDHVGSPPRIAALWEEGKCSDANQRPNRKPFSIVIPPPNVTGALHLGHGLNNTLQDVLVRKRRMEGYDALWMPGTDHAGIATQAVVERRLKEQENKTRHDLGRDALVQRIWSWKEQYEHRILNQLKRMGCSCDWRRTRFTLDDQCAAAVRATFFDLFQQQKIYRGKRLVNWDTFLQTAVSDDEVFNETKKGSFWHFRYPVIDPKPGEPSHVEIATTRPETMLGDTAVAVHPDPASALKKVRSELNAKLKDAPEKERPQIEKQLEELSERESSMLSHFELLRDMAADGRKLMLPLQNREILLVADPWAKPELGSGCVKITPAHDPNDYEVGMRCNLEMINILNPDGTLNANAGTFEGLTIPKARKAVVEALDEQGLLGDVEDRDIELPHSDRSKTPIEPYLADQWFVKMDQLAQSAIDAVQDERVKIFPERYRKTYIEWLSEKRDWPVSRQLWWGHRIPIWSVLNQTPDSAQKLRESVQPLIDEFPQQLALTAGENAEATEEQGNQHLFVCIRSEDGELQSKIESLGFEQDPDVLDTWFSSALWPHSTLGWPDNTDDLAYFYPTSTLITSRDIISLWVARMVLMGLNNVGDIPFHEVYIHPKILDGNGQTMSKSKGNGVDPIDVINKFGPDALRFGLARLTTDTTQDVRMPVQYECPHCEKLIDQTTKNRSLPTIECPACSNRFSTQWAESEADKSHPRGAVVSERFETARNFCNKLWNAARFTLQNLEGYEPAAISRDALPLEDRWLLSRLSTVTKTVSHSLDHYKYSEAAATLYDFAWDEFCSFYVEMAKPRFSVDDSRKSTQVLIASALDQLLRLLHPIMPFLTEDVWQHLHQIAPQRGLQSPSQAEPYLMTASWPSAIDSDYNQEIEQQFAVFQEVLGAIRKIRSSQNIAPRETVPVAIRCDEATVKLLRPMHAYFASLAGAEIDMDATNRFGPQATSFEINASTTLASLDIEVHVDLAKFIDIEAERQRLERKRQQLQKQIGGKESKLSNENFVARAPADVVAKERQTLEEMQTELARVEEDLVGLEKLA